MDVTLLFDPETGESEPAGDDGKLRGRWKVVREGEAVSILAGKRGNKVVLIGSGRWTGKGIGKRYAVSDPIESRTWAKLENALHAVSRDDAPEPAYERRSAHAAPDTGVIPGASPMLPDDRPPEEPRAVASDDSPKDRRSGWWALGAALLALGGFIVSWLSYQPGDTLGLVVLIALGVGALGLLIYNAYGLGTRCPGCKSWYRRETTSVDNLGSSTTTRQISTPVKDSSGKQIGTTYETATFEVTRYRYNYRCKECSHRWTGSGSSESRVS